MEQGIDLTIEPFKPRKHTPLLLVFYSVYPLMVLFDYLPWTVFGQCTTLLFC